MSMSNLYSEPRTVTIQALCRVSKSKTDTYCTTRDHLFEQV